MAMIGTAARRDAPMDWRRLWASRWLWCLAVVLFVSGRDLAHGFGELLNSLGDADDALRLYEVRHLMAGASWFDMTLPRVGGATPLISHWSRLIDLPLVLLLDFFGAFLSPANAELATRIALPMILLFVFLRVLVRAIDLQSGGKAAGMLLCLALTCMTGLFQFRLGRIDHHDGMIMGSVGGLMLLVNARRYPREGYLAGLFIGIGLAVGYEPLAFLLPALAAAALLAVTDMAWLTGVRNMAVALALTLAAIFLVTVAPALWFVARCDALSLNMVVLASCGAAGIGLVDLRGRRWSVATRVAALAAAGVVGAALYGSLDPRCLAGPFGQIDPALKPVWLDHVVEGFNIITFLTVSPLSVVAFIGTAAVGIWAAIERWRRLRTRESRALMVLLVLAVPTGVWMIKLTPYASWIAVFCVALSLADLKATLQLTALSRQLIGVLIASQWTFTMAAAPLLRLAGMSPAVVDGVPQMDGTQCMTTPAISALAALPKGFVVGSIDFGSYIVALTPHDVLAAPYHRIDKAILTNQAILGAEPADARKLLDQAHADYVVLCMPKATVAAGDVLGSLPMPFGGIEARLKAGERVSYLKPVAIRTTVAELKVWQVMR